MTEWRDLIMFCGGLLLGGGIVAFSAWFARAGRPIQDEVLETLIWFRDNAPSLEHLRHETISARANKAIVAYRR